MRLKGLRVLITGAARALGREFAGRLADEGARLVLLDVDRAVLEQAGQLDASAIVTDLAQADLVAPAVEQAAQAVGGLDAVVNNAAVFGPLAPVPFADVPVEEIDRVLAVNVRAVLLVCQAALPHLKTSRGRIVNIGSGSILAGAIGYPHYVAAKGAVFALTRALARELGPDGIRVNTLAPGLLATDDVLATHSTAAVETARSARALGRDEMPGDVAGSLVYLLSSDSDFVTGQMLVVNGGAQLW